MRDGDRILLERLYLVTGLGEEDWGVVVDAVEKAGGIRNVSGNARREIEKAAQTARLLMLKHPGHANQAVHGGSGAGSAGWTPRDRSKTPGGMSVARGDAEGKGFGGKGSFSRNRSDRERIDRQVREAGLDPKAKVKSKAGDSDAMLTKLGEYGGGSGYHGERASAKKTGLDTSRGDKMLIDHASKKGWNIAQLHEFADSKNGRFFADVMIGSGPSDRNTRTAQSLLDMGAGRG